MNKTDGFAIPEIQSVVDGELSFIINRRYHGGFELETLYMNVPLFRYPLLDIAERFLSCIKNNFPILGIWLLSKQKRKETIQNAYSCAIDEFIVSIKMDVANSIFKQGD